MTTSRNLGFVVALGVCWLAGAACSDDTTSSAPEGGVDAGTGGNGATGNGGRAGSGASTSGGRAGSGGARAGAGGTGAGGSSAGAGGAAGAAAGRGGADASTPDASGTGGSGTTHDASVDGPGPDAAEAGREAATAPPKAKQCAYACQTDDDCMVGEDGSQKCDPVTKRCTDPSRACKTNEDCLAFASMWMGPCATDDDCPGGACIDVGGNGLCAPLPFEGDCFPQDSFVEHRFGPDDAGTLTVCGDASGRCGAGQCFFGCTSQTAGCDQSNNGASCNETTGLCECAAASECTAAGVSTCDQTTHQCACAGNQDCTAPGTDTCVLGTCGCSTADACAASPYKNATAVCE